MKSEKLFVGNLSFDVTNNDLRELFQTCGVVVEVDVIRDRGYGFVVMASPEEAQIAFDKLTDYDLLGRMITIEESKPKKDKGDRDNKRTDRSPRAKDQTGKLFIGNLSFNVTNDDLRELFQTVGNVLEADVIKDKGYGFIVMASAEEAKVATVKLTDYELNGRMITIEEPKPKRDRNDRGGNRFDRPRNDRNSRPSYGGNRDGGNRSDRPRNDRNDRPSYGGNRDGGNRSDRPRNDRNDRPSYGGNRDGAPRSDRPRNDRNDRPSYGGNRDGAPRSDRPRNDRNDRPSYGGNRDGANRSSKPSYGGNRDGANRSGKPRSDRGRR